MIQSFLREHLAAAHPAFEWTVDFESSGTNSATVYYEGGSVPDPSDRYFRFPRYMIWLESPDWELTEYAAQQIFAHLNKMRNMPITVTFNNKDGEQIGSIEVFLHRIWAQGEPNRMGVENNKMIYSINFDATISNNEGETSQWVDSSGL